MQATLAEYGSQAESAAVYRTDCWVRGHFLHKSSHSLINCRGATTLLRSARVNSLPDWSDCAKSLVDVAMGREPADTVIRNGRWVNVYSGEILPNTDIAIRHGRFAWVGSDASHTIGPETHIIEANDRYLVPGLCDAHMHVESGMVTVTEFVRAVMPHGTTSMFIDPHEIGSHADARQCVCANAQLRTFRAWA